MYDNYLEWKNKPIEQPPYLSIIIPAYNESERIIPTIGAVSSQVCDLGIEWELIIADDGSTDDTVLIAEDLKLVNMRVLQAPKNGGKGSAVRRGMAAARGQYILFADADNSTPIEEIVGLIAKIENEGFDIVVGSRAAAGAEEANRSRLRRIMSGGLRLIVQNVLRIGVLDTQCGFKLYSREAADKLILSQTIMGFSFDLEHLYLAHKYGLSVAEVPVQWIDAPGSKVDTRKEAQRFLKDLLKIKLNDWRGIYELA
jgi:dolichyl-phosphate beta-glucosyltransferase